jgi:two-component system sensor histidine kinase CpxA
MSQLLDELLQFTRAGVQREIALRPVPLAALVKDVVARDGRGSEIVCDVAPDLVAQAEPALLARALGNVLRNAVRYAGDAGAIVIRAAARNGEVDLTVADQGPGVPAENLSRLFDAFYRPDGARTRETGGAGLGLAIVKTCVDACRGKISAANQTGRGFAVTLSFSSVEA